MKKIITMILIITLTYGINVHALGCNFDELDPGQERLDNMLMDSGVPKTYRQNIIEYVDNNKIPLNELNKVIALTKSTVGLINGRVSVNQFQMPELYEIYNNIDKISSTLKIKIYINFGDGSLSIIDAKTSNVLFQGELKNLNQYYIMYEKIMSNEAFLRKIISDNN